MEPLQQPAESRPDAYSGIDWDAEQNQLEADGDNEGIELLSEVLARPLSQRLPAPVILNALAQRRHKRKVHADLRVAIDLDASTPDAACRRWQRLAEWATVFERWRDSRNIIDFGGPTGPVTADRMYRAEPGIPRSPEVVWLESFRASTASLVPMILDEDLDDVVVQRLLQDLDHVGRGKAVEVESHVREVDLLVRAILGRAGRPKPELGARSDGGPSYRMTGEESANLIGVKPSTLSRWRSKTPAWACSNKMLFQYLIELDRGAYFRDRVVRLADWHRASLDSGGQKPTDCP